MRKLLGSLKRRLKRILAESESVCLWYSGGSDSRLLLETMLLLKKPFGILCFEDGWNREQKKQVDAVILKHNLQVYSYPPHSGYLIGNDAELSYAAFYPVDANGQCAVLMRDLTEDTSRCAFDVTLPVSGKLYAPIRSTVHLWGSRSEDEHYSIGRVIKKPKWNVGETEFKAPLFDWKRHEVLEALASYGIDLSGERDTGNIEACHRCLQGSDKVFCPKVNAEIDSVNWNRDGNLGRLQQMFKE